MEILAKPNGSRVLMLLSNCFDPDPRVHAEARTLVENGYSVLLLGWDRDRARPRTEVIDGIEVERVFVRSSHGRGATQILFLGFAWVAMFLRARHHHFDAIHAHDFDMLPLAMVLGWLRKLPVIYDSHEDYAGMLHGSIPAKLERFIRWFEAKLVRRVSLVITVGDQLRANFEARGGRKCIVVGNWKKLDEFRLPDIVRRQTRKKLAISDDALVVCYIANLGRERRFVELLETVAHRPDVHLIVGGAGPGQDAVEEFARRHANIHYLGFVRQEEIPRYTCAADIVYYGFDLSNPNARFSAPNKLFEALAAGRALMSARFGEIERILDEYKCGLVLQEYSVPEISRALDQCGDPALLARMKSSAAAAAEQVYNWARAEERLLRAYHELIGPRAATVPRREGTGVTA